MPEMDGTETLQAIKWKFPEMPVIAMSSLSKDYLPMMVHLGAYSVAEKSQCFKNVVEKLDQCLSANRMKKEALNVG
jgi:DNA-binding NtrC family response regulator